MLLADDTRFAVVAPPVDPASASSEPVGLAAARAAAVQRGDLKFGPPGSRLKWECARCGDRRDIED